MSFSQYCKLLGDLLKKKQKTTIKYTSSSSYPQLFPIRPGMAQVFIDKGVAILDLPMILLPNEIINKYMALATILTKKIICFGNW
jgi:hypothetical protein